MRREFVQFLTTHPSEQMGQRAQCSSRHRQEHHILFTLDQFATVTNTVQSWWHGGTETVVHALILNGVARQAVVVLLMVRGTMGSGSLQALLRNGSAASTMFCGLPPPLPVIRPVRGFETISSLNLASAMASRKAKW